MLEIMKATYPNLMFKSSADQDFVSLEDLFKDTSANELFSSGILEKSRNRDADYSDFLRQLILYKFGGLYLDMDVIITRQFDSFPRNFAIFQHGPWKLVNGAIMKFDKNNCFLKFHINNQVQSYLQVLFLTRW